MVFCSHWYHLGKVSKKEKKRKKEIITTRGIHIWSPNQRSEGVKDWANLPSIPTSWIFQVKRFLKGSILAHHVRHLKTSHSFYKSIEKFLWHIRHTLVSIRTVKLFVLRIHFLQRSWKTTWLQHHFHITISLYKTFYQIKIKPLHKGLQLKS